MKSKTLGKALPGSAMKAADATQKPSPAPPPPKDQLETKPRRNIPGSLRWPDEPLDLLGVLLDKKAAQDIFGTTSAYAMLQMANFLKKGLGNPKNSDAMELAFSTIRAIQPKDVTEAILISQLILLHDQMSRMLLISRQEGLTLDWVFKAVTAARELSKTYQQGMEALSRYRSGGKQQVVVSHVNVAPGAQAAVAVGCEVRGGQTDAAKQSTP